MVVEQVVEKVVIVWTVQSFIVPRLPSPCWHLQSGDPLFVSLSPCCGRANTFVPLTAASERNIGCKHGEYFFLSLLSTIFAVPAGISGERN